EVPKGEVGVLCMGAWRDAQIIRGLFRDCAEAARLLGVDEEFSGAEANERPPPPYADRARRAIARMVGRVRRAGPGTSPHLAPVRAPPWRSDHSAGNARSGGGRAQDARA